MSIHSASSVPSDDSTNKVQAAPVNKVEAAPVSGNAPKTKAPKSRGATQAPSRSWRVVDIVAASVLATATGLLFSVWNSVGYAWFLAADALTPGLGGIAVGIWLIGGVLGGLVIRKPGAAFYVETLAAVVSMALGSQWAIATVYSGIAQGLGAELIFALFLYRRFGTVPAILSGMGAAVGAFCLELFTSANYAKSLAFNATYLTTLFISGAILAGLVGLILVRSLAVTGVLDRFPAGRERRQAV